MNSKILPGKSLIALELPFFKFIFIYLLTYLFLAVLHLCCCMWAFSSCGVRGLLFVAVHGLLIAVASLVAEHGLYTRGLQYLWCTGLVAPWHVGSFRTRARTRVPCVGRRILNHCATREALELPFKQYFSPLYVLISSQIHPLPPSLFHISHLDNHGLSASSLALIQSVLYTVIRVVIYPKH